MQALDRAFAAHATDAEAILGPHVTMALRCLVEHRGELVILRHSLLQRAHATSRLQHRDLVDQPGTAEPVRRRERLTVRCCRWLLDNHGPPRAAAAHDPRWRIRRAAKLLFEIHQIRGIDHADRVRGRSHGTHGEAGGVRKLLVIGVVAILAILFVQPIRAYRTAQTELTSARTQLEGARAAKERAVKERDALGTREMLVREARRRGYIFPGETPFSVGNR
jgi:hypothetical protein